MLQSASFRPTMARGDKILAMFMVPSWCRPVGMPFGVLPGVLSGAGTRQWARLSPSPGEGRCRCACRAFQLDYLLVSGRHEFRFDLHRPQFPEELQNRFRVIDHPARLANAVTQRFFGQVSEIRLQLPRDRLTQVIEAKDMTAPRKPVRLEPVGTRSEVQERLRRSEYPHDHRIYKPGRCSRI